VKSFTKNTAFRELKLISILSSLLYSIRGNNINDALSSRKSSIQPFIISPFWYFTTAFFLCILFTPLALFFLGSRFRGNDRIFFTPTLIIPPQGGGKLGVNRQARRLSYEPEFSNSSFNVFKASFFIRETCL